MSKIRLITFDATNTLFKVCGSVGEIYSKTALKYESKMDPQEMDRNFRKAFKEFNKNFPNFGQTVGMSSRQWWNKVISRSFNGHVKPDVLEKISSELWVNFTKKTHWELFPEVIPVLQQFQGQGIQLGVVSNFDERLPRIMEALEIKKYFSFILASQQTKCFKPSPEIFHHAVSMVTRCGPTEAIHVGDNYELDYKAAMNAGMDAYLLQRKPSDSKINNDLDHIPLHKVIWNLGQLCNVITI